MQAGCCEISHQFELDWSSCLLLNDCRAVADAAATNDIPGFNLNDVAAAKLAIDGQIEKRAVSKAPVLIQKKADRPNVARFQRSFGADQAARIPRPPLAGGGIKIGNSHNETCARVSLDGLFCAILVQP